MPTRKSRQREIFAGDVVGSTNWAGASQINSGDASATVSASAIQSGSPVLFGLTHVAANSGQTLGLTVDSIVDGVSFLAITQSQIAANDNQPFTYTIVRN